MSQPQVYVKRLKGRIDQRWGVATAMTDQQEVTDCLMNYLRKVPQIAQYIGVGLLTVSPNPKMSPRQPRRE